MFKRQINFQKILKKSTYTALIGNANFLKIGNPSYYINRPVSKYKYFSSVSGKEENEEIDSSIPETKPSLILDIPRKVSIPYYCSIFHLAEILEVDMIELVSKFRETVQIEINDPMEYLQQDDIELFMLEQGIDFEVLPHKSVKIKRPMVVTIMGHVDHGKTTLLDTFRNSKLVDSEFGKITQTIGAFNITLEDSKTELTFIDTPGHEAFVKMRQRGAKTTDAVIVVVSGIESVQKQTVEVLNIIKAIKVPFIIAVNKCDRDQADPERVYNDLLAYDIKVRQLGGNIPAIEISAKTRMNVDLLGKELADLNKSLNLEEETNIQAQAFIIESKTSKVQAYVNPSASVIVRKGVLKEGDYFICGEDSYGKVKHMTNDLGQHLKEAIPGRAVEVIGFKNPPQAGSVLAVMDNITLIEKLIENRRKLKEYNESKQKEFFNKGFKLGKLRRKERKILMKGGGPNLDYLKEKIEGALATGKNNADNVDQRLLKEVYLHEEVRKKKIIIFCDTIGMLETIEDELLREFDQNKLNETILKTGVGPAITEEEFKLAKSANAVFFTFNLDQEIDGFADIYKVGVRKHKLIYNIVEEIKNFIKESDLRDPRVHYIDPDSDETADNPDTTNDFFKGRGRIGEVFKIKFNNKHTNIAGCEVLSGLLNNHSRYRLVRDDQVYKLDLRISSLKQNKVNVNIVREGEECGIIFENFDDLKEGDYIDCYDINPKFEGITNTKSVVDCYSV